MTFRLATHQDQGVASTGWGRYSLALSDEWVVVFDQDSWANQTDESGQRDGAPAGFRQLKWGVLHRDGTAVGLYVRGAQGGPTQLGFQSSTHLWNDTIFTGQWVAFMPMTFSAYTLLPFGVLYRSSQAAYGSNSNAFSELYFQIYYLSVPNGNPAGAVFHAVNYAAPSMDSGSYSSPGTAVQAFELVYLGRGYINAAGADQFVVDDPQISYDSSSDEFSGRDRVVALWTKGAYANGQNGKTSSLFSCAIEWTFGSPLTADGQMQAAYWYFSSATTVQDYTNVNPNYSGSKTVGLYDRMAVRVNDQSVAFMIDDLLSNAAFGYAQDRYVVVSDNGVSGDVGVAYSTHQAISYVGWMSAALVVSGEIVAHDPSKFRTLLVAPGNNGALPWPQRAAGLYVFEWSATGFGTAQSTAGETYVYMDGDSAHSYRLSGPYVNAPMPLLSATDPGPGAADPSKSNASWTLMDRAGASIWRVVGVMDDFLSSDYRTYFAVLEVDDTWRSAKLSAGKLADNWNLRSNPFSDYAQVIHGLTDTVGIMDWFVVNGSIYYSTFEVVAADLNRKLTVAGGPGRTTFVRPDTPHPISAGRAV